jgi:hypothetical protein
MDLLQAPARRRLGGVVLVLAGLAVAAVVILSSTGTDPGRGRGRGITAGKGSSHLIPAGRIRLVSVPPLGLAFAHPTSWRRSVQGRVIRLRAPDGSAVLTLASPVAGDHAGAVERQAQALLAQRLAPARVVRRAATRLAGRAAESVELVGGSASNHLRALLIVGATAYRTYAVTLLTAPRPSRARLTEVSGILATINLTRPQGPGS